MAIRSAPAAVQHFEAFPVEKELRKAIIIYLGTAFNWDEKKMASAMLKGIHTRPDRPKPKALFQGRTPQEVINQLYTIDLKAIVAENWEFFKPLFDNNKARFEMNMDTINLARREEGHTKPVSTTQAENFENSYSWLLARLQKVTAV